MPARVGFAARAATLAASTLAAVASVAIALAGCGGSGAGSTARSTSTTKPTPAASVDVTPRTTGSAATPGHPQATATEPASTVPDGDPTGTARSPALRHLQALLVGNMGPEGDQSGLLVYDMTTGATLFTSNADVGRPPASVEKLYTTIATDALLGPDATFPTVILGTGHLTGGGVWHGNLYLRGDGDPTFGDGTFNHIDEDGYGPTAAQLVAQLRHDGIRHVTGEVIGDESRFDSRRGGPLTNYQPDPGDYGGELSALVYDHGATAANLSPPAFAARELVLTMHGAHIGAKADAHAGIAPQDARGLASVSSPPVSVLLRLMDVPSDDLFADLLAKQLGYSFDGQGTLAAGAQQIEDLIKSRYDLHPTIYDGSGLDKADRSSPAQVVALLRAVWGTPAGHALASSLPVVGESGTVQTIGVHTAAQGHCIAKTGTLNYVTNLAGYCHALGGNLLAFAVLIDGPGNWTALEAISKIIGDIAAY
ncbi:MAG: D-alanyl-D-alanine carboxypeptidase [Solirubrobacteraceae bacterium]